MNIRTFPLLSGQAFQGCPSILSIAISCTVIQLGSERTSPLMVVNSPRTKFLTTKFALSSTWIAPKSLLGCHWVTVIVVLRRSLCDKAASIYESCDFKSLVSSFIVIYLLLSLLIVFPLRNSRTWCWSHQRWFARNVQADAESLLYQQYDGESLLWYDNILIA